MPKYPTDGEFPDTLDSIRYLEPKLHFDTNLGFQRFVAAEILTMATLVANR